MRSGRLRNWVTIQEVTETRDDYGGVVETWSTFATAWAGIEPISGREYFASKQTQAEVTHRITIRYISGLTTKMRVLWGTRVFEIDSIINFRERNSEVQIMASEAV